VRKIRFFRLLATIGDGVEDRIRQDGQTFERIIKKGKGLKREEIPQPIPLTKAEFNELWKNIISEKSETRYFIPVDGGTAELKMLHGRDEGKGEVEVEFKSIKKAKNFKPPDWFGKEVTEDEQYTSESLATNGYPEEARLPLSRYIFYKWHIKRLTATGNSTASYFDGHPS